MISVEENTTIINEIIKTIFRILKFSAVCIGYHFPYNIVAIVVYYNSVYSFCPKMYETREITENFNKAGPVFRRLLG